LNRFLSGRGVADADALLDGDGLLVVVGGGLLVVAGSGLLVVVAADVLVPCAFAGAVWSENCAHVIRATTPATNTNTNRVVNFSVLLFMPRNIVQHSLGRQYAHRGSWTTTTVS
jgi:hypothetical protein